MNLAQKREAYGSDDQSWIDSRAGLNNGKSCTIDLASFTKATHYPDGFLKSGLPLAKITANGHVGLYDNAATDGRGTLWAVLLSGVEVADGATSVVGAALLTGRIKAVNLPVAIDAAGQGDVAGRLIFV